MTTTEWFRSMCASHFSTSGNEWLQTVKEAWRNFEKQIFKSEIPTSSSQKLFLIEVKKSRLKRDKTTISTRFYLVRSGMPDHMSEMGLFVEASKSIPGSIRRDKD